jgi:hypothetical protein
MPPTIEELAVRIEKEVDSRERAIKYAHNMMEDIKTAFSDFKFDFGRLGQRLDSHITEDQKMGITIKEIKGSLEGLKRLVWIGVGGVVVIAGLLAVIGGRLLTLLSKV